MNRKYITLSNPRFALTLIISFALLARVIALRDPSHQFFGWLNHVYYYFVQVRELMDSGNLAFNDLPLLFYIYSALAYFLELFGFARETSIIYSTRIYMTVIPVLIPILVYLIVVRLNDREIPSRNQLLLIFCSGFLPLSLLHMPEYLQKNMFGILLLIGFIYYSYKFLSVKTKKDGLILIIFILFITLSHFGTLAALLMLITSMIIASAAIERKLSGLFKVGGGLILFILTAGSVIYLFDPSRVERITFYLKSTLRNSATGKIFLGELIFGEVFFELSVLGILMLAAYLLCRQFCKLSFDLNRADRIIWLSSILFLLFLLMPIFGPDVTVRMLLFAPVPLLIIILFLEKYWKIKFWMKRSVIVIITTVLLMMALGEYIGMKVNSQKQKDIYSGLIELKKMYNFDKNDLVLTQTGADHVCIWHFNTRAGVISSFNVEDFEKYENVFVLNAVSGYTDIYKDKAGKLDGSETTKYTFMRNLIPVEDNFSDLVSFETIEFYRLKNIPSNWRIDVYGNWAGYK